MIQISIWPLIAAAVSSVVIGYVWYHPRVFGSIWMRLNGISPEMAERGAKRMHIYAAIGFCAFVVSAYIMRELLRGLGFASPADAACLGLALWIGFAAPILLGSVLWEHRPITLYIINIGYWLVALVIMAVILVI